MGIGHIAAGIAFKKLDAKTNAAWFVFAALLADFLLWVLILVGKEQLIIPDDYAQIRYMRFVFPISHGILASVGWAILIAGVAFAFLRDSRSALLVGLASMTHIFLDWLVHVVPFEVIGGLTLEGLGLWKNIKASVMIEFLLSVGCLFLYLKSTSSRTALGRFGMVVFIALLMIVMFGGQLFAPMPDSVQQIASSSIVTLLAIVLVVRWLDSKRSTQMS
ncbi:MAG: hypothetical protein K8S54_11950 [Spirochaetia bacterium]|nr:hypothetical protein [Spirochaetia bacterium]